MLQKSIKLSNLTYALPHKTLFENLSVVLHPREHVALIGDNGSGKSTLLRIILGELQPHAGAISRSEDLRIGYLPQDVNLQQDSTIYEVACQGAQDIFAMRTRFEQLVTQPLDNPQVQDEYDGLLEKLLASDGFVIEKKIDRLLSRMGLFERKDDLVATLSGGEQMLLGFVSMLAAQPDVILLDEPTNHLDKTNREKLFSFLSKWTGALLVVTHDIELLKTIPHKIWHLTSGALEVFDGRYEDYICEKGLREQQLARHIETLKREKRTARLAVEREKQRSAKRTVQGIKKYGNDKPARDAAKQRGENFTGKRKQELQGIMTDVADELSGIRIPEQVVPTFDLEKIREGNPKIEIRDGSVGYQDMLVLQKINLFIGPSGRIALRGDNGSGKSTLLRAICGDAKVTRQGMWHLPSPDSIGYLDQHYSLLDSRLSVFDTIKQVRPDWNTNQMRSHLVRFLFRKNEEVESLVATLSGGEKARLALAVIAAQSPGVLILDEVTNNLDLTTRRYLIDVISAYPGMLIVVSHDEDFLKQIGLSHRYVIEDGALRISELELG